MPPTVMGKTGGESNSRKSALGNGDGEAKDGFEQMYMNNVKNEDSPKTAPETPKNGDTHEAPPERSKQGHESAEPKSKPAKRNEEKPGTPTQNTLAEAEQDPSTDVRKTQRYIAPVRQTQPFISHEEVNPPEIQVETPEIPEDTINPAKTQHQISWEDRGIPPEQADYERALFEAKRRAGRKKIAIVSSAQLAGKPEKPELPGDPTPQPKTKNGHLTATRQWDGVIRPENEGKVERTQDKADVKADKIQQTADHSQRDTDAKLAQRDTDAKLAQRDTDAKLAQREDKTATKDDRTREQAEARTEPASRREFGDSKTVALDTSSVIQSASAAGANKKSKGPAPSEVTDQKAGAPGAESTPSRELSEDEEEVVIVKPKERPSRPGRVTSVESEVLSTMPIDRNKLDIVNYQDDSVDKFPKVDHGEIPEGVDPELWRAAKAAKQDVRGTQMLSEDELKGMKPDPDRQPKKVAKPKIEPRELPPDVKVSNMKTNVTQQRETHPQDLLEAIARTRKHFQQLRAEQPTPAAPNSETQKPQDVEVTSTINLPRGLDELKRKHVPEARIPDPQPGKPLAVAEQVTDPQASNKANANAAHQLDAARTKAVEDLARMINDRVQVAASQESSSSIRLSMDFNSSRLGNVSVSVEQNANGQLNVTLQAESDGSRQQLNGQRDELARQLRQMGYDQVNVEVHTGQQNEREQTADDDPDANPDENVQFRDEDGNVLEDLG